MSDSTNKNKANKRTNFLSEFLFNKDLIIRYGIWGVLTVLLLMIFSPYIFTRESFTSVDFATTGNIGDTIGGLTTPFIGIIGIIVTFLAFYIQYDFNKKQSEIIVEQHKMSKEQHQILLEQQIINIKQNFEPFFMRLIDQKEKLYWHETPPQKNVRELSSGDSIEFDLLFTSNRVKLNDFFNLFIGTELKEFQDNNEITTFDSENFTLNEGKFKSLGESFKSDKYRAGSEVFLQRYQSGIKNMIDLLLSYKFHSDKLIDKSIAIEFFYKYLLISTKKELKFILFYLMLLETDFFINYYLIDEKSKIQIELTVIEAVFYEAILSFVTTKAKKH